MTNTKTSVLNFANCGHEADTPIESLYGYTMCSTCLTADMVAGVEYCSRISGVYDLDNMVFQTPDGSARIGTVVECVNRELNFTPTGGRYASTRMTVTTRGAYSGDSRRWVGQVKKGSPQVILRAMSS